MSHIRLIGLLLFITAITLALAAAATRTTHVRVSRQWLLVPIQHQPALQAPYGEPLGFDAPHTMSDAGSAATGYTGSEPFPSTPESVTGHAHTHDWDYAAHQAQFDTTAIPIAWPLLGTGAAGLLLWFVQSPAELRPAFKKRSSQRRRRR